ncbi:MAG: hypothetical protein M1814_005381 [Vezdaea aestivalis]|nr:MAG: hypothetical protein M1814_005381 [Vezdaea aestivalis]
MGSYLFTWAHPAEEVHVTGTFDDWTKSVVLEKKGERFEKLVDLPKADEKIFYKFYVDGEWKLDHTAPQQEDGHNNLNNVLTPDHITKKPVTMSSAAPTSSTAALAGAVPLESKGSKSQPGAAAISSAAPDSSTAALAKEVPLEDKVAPSMPGNFPETPQSEPAAFSVNPIPATAGAGNPIKLKPGEKVPPPSELTKNTVSSTVVDDPELAKKDQGAKSFSVNPLPATAGAGNPIHLKAGEKVPDPSTFTSNTVASTVTTDKESHEKGPANAIPGSAPSAAASSGAFGVLPVTLGASGSHDTKPVTISSASPESTTAGLAGSVPLEPKGTATVVPDVVKESQAEAQVAPEASASPEAVKEKAAVESELKKEVTPAPATSDGLSTGQVAGIAAGGAAATGGAVAAAAIATKDKVTGTSDLADGVPATVEKSISASHQSPEAAANKEAVAEKKTVESELLKEIKPEQSTGEPAPTITAAKTATAPATQTSKPRIDSRDISPMSRPHGEMSTVTPVAASASTPTKPAPAAAATESNSSPASANTDKKKNRRSFFGKIKDKLKH